MYKWCNPNSNYAIQIYKLESRNETSKKLFYKSELQIKFLVTLVVDWEGAEEIVFVFMFIFVFGSIWINFI